MLMTLVFDQFSLDPQKAELRREGTPVQVERRVLALLVLLAENADRLVSKDEIVEKIWDGRIVSDSAIATGIKDARKAVGDDGTRQAVIKTIHGRGFRFAATVRRVADAVPASREAGEAPVTLEPSDIPGLSGKPSIAVLPFQVLGGPPTGHTAAEAIPAELISALSRLRWLFVTARGSSFRFREADVSPETIRTALGVRYCLTGLVEMVGPIITVTVELADTGAGVVIWGDRYSTKIDEVHQVRAEIVAGVIAALEIHIPLNEANAARLLAPENLDSWAAYHLGLQHMYRFNKADNAAAGIYFADAVAKEPGFARAHAGLSFVRFQNVFLKYEPDADRQINLAVEAAQRSLELDPVDPFANFNMGRTRWLLGDVESGLPWLDRALQVSPNFAQGHYAKAWSDTLAGRAGDAQQGVDLAMALSPLDPLYYAMLGTRALSLIGENRDAEAVVWAERGALAPGAHYLVVMIAVAATEIAGERARAQGWAERVRAMRPDAAAAAFFRSFPYTDATARERLTRAFENHGF